MRTGFHGAEPALTRHDDERTSVEGKALLRGPSDVNDLSGAAALEAAGDGRAPLHRHAGQTSLGRGPTRAERPTPHHRPHRCTDETRVHRRLVRNPRLPHTTVGAAVCITSYRSRADAAGYEIRSVFSHVKPASRCGDHSCPCGEKPDMRTPFPPFLPGGA